MVHTNASCWSQHTTGDVTVDDWPWRERTLGEWWWEMVKSEGEKMLTYAALAMDRCIEMIVSLRGITFYHNLEIISFLNNWGRNHEYSRVFQVSVIFTTIATFMQCISHPCILWYPSLLVNCEIITQITTFTHICIIFDEFDKSIPHIWGLTHLCTIQ